MQNIFSSKWYSLIVLLTAQILIISDNTGLSISTANIIAELNTSLDQVQFSLAMYPMIAGSLMIAGGMLGLVIGWKRLFQIGVGLYVGAELVIATASDINTLIFAGRVLAGLAGSMIIPAVLGMIPGIYFGKDRVKAFSLVAAAVAIGSAVSPFIFALIIDRYNFQVGFWLMMILFSGLFLSSLFIKPIPLPEKKVKFDFIGMLMMSFATFLFMIGLMKISEWGIWQASDAATSIMGISPSPFLVLAGLIVFYLFLQWEKRRDANGSDCLLPMEFVKSAQVRAGLGITAFAFMAFVTITFVVVSYIQLVGEFSAMKTAGILLFFSAGMIAGSLGAPALLAKWSASAVNSLGFAAIIIGMVSMYFGLEVTGINFLMTLGMVLFGIGLGVVSAQMSLIVTEAISHQGAMQSGGVQATFRGIGEALGIAVLGTVLMLSTTSSIKKMGLSHQEISRETADLIIDINTIPFSTNESFKRILDDYVNNEKDKEVLMTIKADARKKAAGHSLFAMMSLVAVFYLLFQKAVPKRSLMDN